jgi:hypothetical protein
MGRNPCGFAWPSVSVDFLLANVISVSSSVLHRVGGRESIAIGILQQASQEARKDCSDTSTPSVVASQLILNLLPEIPRNNALVLARIDFSVMLNVSQVNRVLQNPV